MRALVDLKNPCDNSSSDAMSIVETLATTTGASLLEADFPSFAKCFMLPHYIITQSGEREVQCIDELRSAFFKVIDHYRISGVDRMERYCLFGTFINDRTINCAHESRLFKGDTLVQQPFVAHSQLKLVADTWKIYSTEYSISDSLRYVRALSE